MIDESEAQGEVRQVRAGQVGSDQGRKGALLRMPVQAEEEEEEGQGAPPRGCLVRIA